MSKRDTGLSKLGLISPSFDVVWGLGENWSDREMGQGKHTVGALED